MFSLFRNRGPRPFEITTRYHDPLRERMDERIERLSNEVATGDRTSADRRMFSERMRHSWQRDRSNGNYVMRLLVVLGAVLVMLFVVYHYFFDRLG